MSRSAPFKRASTMSRSARRSGVVPAEGWCAAGAERGMRLRYVVSLTVALALTAPAARAQVKGHLPPTITPPWTNGIQPISRESYWNAIDLRQAARRRGRRASSTTPNCARTTSSRWRSTRLYKQVAYTVWQAVSHKQPAPTPSYGEAQRTRIIVGLKPLHRSQNPVAGLTIARGKDDRATLLAQPGRWRRHVLLRLRAVRARPRRSR